MAIRRTNILGKLSGRIGPTTTRIRYGKEVIYSLPDKVNVSNSPAAKTARKKFGLTVNFAKFVNSKPGLSAVWKAAQVPGVNSYQRLIKHNAKLTGETNLTIKNIITPPGKLSAPFNFSFKDDIIALEINSGLRSSLPIILHLVLYYYEPAAAWLEEFSFDYIQKEIDDSHLDGNIPVSLKLNGTQKSLCENYNHCIIYAAVTLSKGKIKWSSTFSTGM